MPKRVLAIGVGGSGKAALTILKERLQETYGQTPDNVVLLSLDTDDLREVDTFAGMKLNPLVDERGREAEFTHVISPPGMTMNTIFADIANGRTAAYMDWLEKDKLSHKLGPAERDIRGGAQQRRPVGRVALFLRWSQVYQSIINAISRVYGEPEIEQAVDKIVSEKSKRLIFIVGSLAGGTGSGFLIDVANLVRHAVQSNQNWQSVDVSALIVLPDAFQSYTTLMDDPTNLKPNSYAALRELDRFIRTHSAALPYPVRYGDDLRSLTWSTNQPVDHTYLIDTASRGAMGDLDLSGDPGRGVFPVVADFIMAHVDGSLGDALATLRSNAGSHYDKEEGWQYSSFNVMNYIFPMDDVIKSFSYRFLRELLAQQFLPIDDAKTNAQVEQAAGKLTETLFSENTVKDRVNPGLIPKTIAATRRVKPEPPEVSWPGLFNMMALSEGKFADDYQALQDWLVYLNGNLRPSKDGDYKAESFEEGYRRLLNFSEQFMDDCLGPRIDPDDEDKRLGGEWDKILDPYREALRLRFSEALDAALLEMLNQRDPQTKVLAPARLPSAQFMVKTLKKKMVEFKQLVIEQYRRLEVDARLRHSREQLRETIAWIQNTKEARGFSLFGKPEARKAQEAYISLFYEKMELTLHQRVFRTLIDILDALGAAEKDRDDQESVLDRIDLELGNWQATFQDVDKILVKGARQHEKQREDKRQVRVRRYLTNPPFEDQLYRQPTHSGQAAGRVLGQVRGENGLIWQRHNEANPLSYKIVTRGWATEANGAEEIAHNFLAGAKALFQGLRQYVTIADRVAAEFTTPAGFVNTVSQIDQPFLRYQPASNGKPLFHERYVSFNLEKADDAGRQFLQQAYNTLRNQGLNVDTAAESLVACTVVEIARGARLNAVDQFTACEPDYRAKLHKGQESLHLFPEEQVATGYESRIEKLGEPDNRQRTLSPELVIAMGDETKLKTFILACAYGLIKPGDFLDPSTGEQSTEIFLTWSQNGSKRNLRLSDSKSVKKLDPHFDDVAAEGQIARLYLNALQNFSLKATEKRGVPDQMIAILVQDLKQRGVSLDHIDNPFTLSLLAVNKTINQQNEKLKSSDQIQDHLQLFLDKTVQQFKKGGGQRICDLGTVMHLILDAEINRLRGKGEGG